MSNNCPSISRIRFEVCPLCPRWLSEGSTQYPISIDTLITIPQPQEPLAGHEALTSHLLKVLTDPTLLDNYNQYQRLAPGHSLR